MSLGYWMNYNDPEFKGSKFWRWLAFTGLALGAQGLILYEVFTEGLEKTDNTI